MKNYVKSTVTLIQILILLFIPFVVGQHLFPGFDPLKIAGPINSFTLAFFSKFSTMKINNVDWSLLFIVIPWILYIIVLGMFAKMFENVEDTVVHTQTQKKLKKNVQIIQYREKQNREKLLLKNRIYLTVSVVFSKFTISSLSDREIEEKKSDIKKDLIKDLYKYNGKIVEDEAFDDDDTFAMAFITQDDAVNYVLKFRELIAYFDNLTQGFGYSVSYKAILDAKDSSAVEFQVLEFAEKALRAIDIAEIAATNDFANKYKEFGKIKQITFVSKGNYSINKSRVELNKLEY